MYSLFSEQQSENAVIERLQQCKDDRFKTIMTSAIKHLHGFVKEVEPTMEEWTPTGSWLTVFRLSPSASVSETRTRLMNV